MNILITAGPTREFLDPVRFISNPATGTLGYIIAAKAALLGHSVTLVTGPTFLKIPDGVIAVRVTGALEMRDEVLNRFPFADALIMTAAVSDWRPVQRFNEKLKLKKPWNLKLIPNPDILKAVARIKRKNQVVIGFALETESLVENGWKKLKEKKLDMIVVNDLYNFGQGNTNSAIFILHRDGTMKDCTGFSKARLASYLLTLLDRFGNPIYLTVCKKKGGK